jgi:hypothetical protein
MCSVNRYRMTSFELFGVFLFGFDFDFEAIGGCPIIMLYILRQKYGNCIVSRNGQYATVAVAGLSAIEPCTGCGFLARRIYRESALVPVADESRRYVLTGITGNLVSRGLFASDRLLEDRTARIASFFVCFFGEA